MAEEVNIIIEDGTKEVNVSVERGGSFSGDYNDLANKPTTISTAQAAEIAANTLKYTQSEVDALLTAKQNTLIAGSNITIIGDTISATASGSTLTTTINATNEILATSETQTIEVTGINLDQITTISLTDSSTINVATDVNIITDNLIELTVTMNSTEGAKDLVVNGTTYSNWIQSLYNAGFTYLGSDYGYVVQQGTSITDNIERHNATNNVVQYSDCVVLSNGSSANWQRFAKFNEFKASNNQTIEYIIKVGRLNSSADLLAVGVIESSIDVTSSDNYGLNTSNSMQIAKDYFDIASVSGMLYRANNNSLRSTWNFPITDVSSFGDGNYLLIRESKDKMCIFSLDSINDRVGNLISEVWKNEDLKWSSNTDYSPYLNTSNRNMTSLGMVAVRVKN